MHLKDIMAKKVITIGGEETIVNAAKRMEESNIGCVVVTNAGKVLGIITDRDLAVRCLSKDHNSGQCRVSSHMSSPVITARPEMDILDAAHLMTGEKVKRLPVVEDDRLIGLVSFSDVAQAMDRPMHDLMVGMGAARRIA
jgi:CBS domain-containing protein